MENTEFSAAALGLCRIIKKNLNGQQTSGVYEYALRFLKLSDDEAMQLYHEYTERKPGVIAAKVRSLPNPRNL